MCNEPRRLGSTSSKKYASLNEFNWLRRMRTGACCGKTCCPMSHLYVPIALDCSVDGSPALCPPYTARMTHFRLKSLFLMIKEHPYWFPWSFPWSFRYRFDAKGQRIRCFSQLKAAPIEHRTFPWTKPYVPLTKAGCHLPFLQNH